MTSRLWIYAGPQGHSAPVTEEALAALAAEGTINAETPVRPADVASWAPLSVWLPRLYPEPPKIPHPRGAWIDREPHPWRRYFARIIDSLVVGGLTWAVISVVFYLTAPIEADLFFSMFEGATGSFLNVFLTLVASIPGMALMTGLTGLTAGRSPCRTPGRSCARWRRNGKPGVKSERRVAESALPPSPCLLEAAQRPQREESSR